ncbi:acid protease [Sporormia fimetaria CBS 119925]|uniref:Acid protease n=1 Tax=Sporormia fimetaria CBS 119925 TaxID=1340428 RepID=A0A6A6UZE0_9PLEO|nr:acid protease [Sporormia fimetaria CBS 119925]
MASLAVYLSATVLFAQSTVAFDCSKKPIYVDIHRRAVHESSEFQYGSFIGVGTPAQNHSLWPSLSQNHTSFATLDYCNNSTLRNCDTSTGGRFTPQDSTSLTLNDDMRSLDPNHNSSLFSTSLAQDTLRLYTHYLETDPASQTLVNNTTIALAETGVISPGIVGMGPSSSLLSSLASQEIIAARTYSLYIGQAFARAGGAVNGSNVFGGYDAGRFTEPVHTYAMKDTSASPFTVTVKDIVITLPDASTVSLLDSARFPSTGNATTAKPAPFEAQISTHQYPLSLPYSITQNFMQHVQASEDPDNTWGDSSLRTSADFVPGTTMTMILDDGFSVTLPSEVLSNASNITPIQSRSPSSTQPFYLGAAFLTQVYLMADYESKAFYLAPAVQKNNYVMPQTFCPRSVPTPYVRNVQPRFVKEGLIGAVIGGVVGFAGLTLMAWMFLRAWLRRRDMREREVEEGGGKVWMKKVGLGKKERVKVEEMEVEFEGPPRREKTAWRWWRK